MLIIIIIIFNEVELLTVFIRGNCGNLMTSRNAVLYLVLLGESLT